jgi:hypothetical protein
MYILMFNFYQIGSVLEDLVVAFTVDSNEALILIAIHFYNFEDLNLEPYTEPISNSLRTLGILDIISPS